MDTKTVVATARVHVQSPAKNFSSRFDPIPEDKMLWKPENNGKEALYIGAHIAIANTRQAKIISGGTIEPKPIAELVAWLASKEKEYSSKKQVQDALVKSYATLEDAFSSLDTVDVHKTVMAPWGQEISLVDFLFVPASHMRMHAGQLDYIQLCYGDTNLYF